MNTAGSTSTPANGLATITVTGSGTVTARADRLILNVALDCTEREITLVERRMAADRKAVADALAAARVPPERIRSHGLHIAPAWSWEKDRHVFKGFRGTETIVVRVPLEPGRGIELVRALAPVLEHVHIDLSFVVRDATEPKSRALGAAVANARDKADVIARAAGERLGNLRGFHDESTYLGRRDVGSSVASGNAHDEGGFGAINQEVTATITGVWEMERTL